MDLSPKVLPRGVESAIGRYRWRGIRVSCRGSACGPASRPARCASSARSENTHVLRLGVRSCGTATHTPASCGHLEPHDLSGPVRCHSPTAGQSGHQPHPPARRLLDRAVTDCRDRRMPVAHAHLHHTGNPRQPHPHLGGGVVGSRMDHGVGDQLTGKQDRDVDDRPVKASSARADVTKRRAALALERCGGNRTITSI